MVLYYALANTTSLAPNENKAVINGLISARALTHLNTNLFHPLCMWSERMGTDIWYLRFDHTNRV